MNQANKQTDSIKQALDRVEQYSQDHLRILLFDLYGFEWNQLYERDDYNAYYTEYQCFQQDSWYGFSIVSFLLLTIFIAIVDIQENLIQKEANQKILDSVVYLCENYLFQIGLIITILLTKRIIKNKLSKSQTYQIQNLIIAFLSLYVCYIDRKGVAVSLIMLSLSSGIQSLPIKILVILLIELNLLKTFENLDLALILINIFIGIAVTIVLGYQDIQKYTSFVKDYKQLKQNKINTKKLIKKIIDMAIEDNKEFCQRNQIIQTNHDEDDDRFFMT